MAWAFEDFVLDTDRFELRGADGPVSVEPQVFDVLSYLVEHHDRVVAKEELLDEIWGNRFVSESALSSRIKLLRRALGDDGRQQRLVRTAHGRGYQFVGAPEPIDADDHAAVGSVESVATSSPTDPGDVTAGHAAVAERRWSDADAAFSRADADGSLTAADLEAWAESRWWLLRIDDAEATRLRAFQAHRHDGDDLAAARVALALADDYYRFGSVAVEAGWLSRAERLIGDRHDTAEFAELQRARVIRILERDRRPDDALAMARSATELAERVGDPDLQALLRQDQGRALVAMGRGIDGLQLIDDAMVAAVAGEVRPKTEGRLYCNMLAASMDLLDYRRAAEWTDRALSWCDLGQDEAVYPGVCQVHRAGLMRRRGDFDAALAQAERSARLLDFPEIASAAWREIGDIQLRQGRLDVAAEAYTESHRLGLLPLPGTAILDLMRGEPERAAAVLQDSLDEPGRTPAERARLLPHLVEATVASGAVDAAEAASAEMDRLGDDAMPLIEGAAAYGRGVVASAQERWDDAASAFQAAIRNATDLALPYEAAISRIGQAHACLTGRLGSSGTAELSAATTAMARMGAVPVGLPARWFADLT